ncbi:flagellar hook-associated protein FlgK [Devosia pacifica]|uniref:Flagellar hook-associated protein 1 n=1 Tax=Devosia pacifica TaxID=1335967 RepID=A0A918RXI8_9HYPH|nr:flagellar hook-associated protein FlgK [Devosia pacifica]GHA14803.1 flagellar hook-associated protein FlgK [Devosia pacifica]
MGLLTSINNAVSGIRVNQDSLNLVSKNIANSGTPGYHRQSLSVIDYGNEASSYARTSGVQRAFNQSLQTYYTSQVSTASQASTKAAYLDRLQTFMGKPGSEGSLDTVYQNLKNAFETLSVSPDDHAARAEVVSKSQTFTGTLNRLWGNVRDMRLETETKMSSAVDDLNDMLTSLGDVNQRLQDVAASPDSRTMLLDRRDSLVSEIAEKIDVRADYKLDGTVALRTKSGVGLIDGRVSRFSYESSGAVGEGRLMLTSPGGNKIDLAKQGGLQGGELAALVDLRDNTLAEAEAHLDQIAASLAQVFGTNTTEGDAATVGAAEGFDINLNDLEPGNDLLISYSENGIDKQVRVVNTTKTVDYQEPDGTRVLGVDIENLSTADVALALGGQVSGLAFSDEGSGTLRVLDDGAAGTTNVNKVIARATSDGAQGDGLGLNLFTDGARPFTRSLEGDPPQVAGFAGRIAVNPAVVADNRLLVQYEAGGSLGESTRPDYLLAQLGNRDFASSPDAVGADKGFKLSGTLGEIVTQTINYQGRNVATALGRQQDTSLALDTVTTQMQSEYGVNLDEEMARLIELQNAYAANARVISVVQELMDRLLAI